MRRHTGVWMMLAFLGVATAAAQPAAEDSAAEGSAAEEPSVPNIEGPKLVDLGHEIEVDLPEGMLLIEEKHAKDLLREEGANVDSVIALIGKAGANWMVIVEYSDIGYVTDTDADQLDASELFTQYVEGTKQQNVRRRSLGVPELFLDGWSEKPVYRKQAHHLVWGLRGHTSEGQVINFFTRILGRNGYISVNLIDSPDTIEQAKQEAAPVLGNIRYKAGFTYADHQEGDRSSGLGLRALVLGGTGVAVMKAAKAGFIIKLLLVFKKGFLFIVLGIGGLFKWLLGRKSAREEEAAVAPPTDAAPPTDSEQ